MNLIISHLERKEIQILNTKIQISNNNPQIHESEGNYRIPPLVLGNRLERAAVPENNWVILGIRFLELILDFFEYSKSHLKK